MILAEANGFILHQDNSLPHCLCVTLKQWMGDSAVARWQESYKRLTNNIKVKAVTSRYIYWTKQHMIILLVIPVSTNRGYIRTPSSDSALHLSIDTWQRIIGMPVECQQLAPANICRQAWFGFSVKESPIIHCTSLRCMTLHRTQWLHWTRYLRPP